MRRRAFIEGVLASGAVAAVGNEARAEPGRPSPQKEPQARAPSLDPPGDAQEVWPLLAPLGAGAAIGLGWSVGSLAGVVHGAAVLTLTHSDGREARVHLCRRTETSSAPAHSESIDLFLMNEGDGGAATDESLGRVLNVLALVIRHNEKRGAGATEAMIAHEARLLFYREGNLLV